MSEASGYTMDLYCDHDGCLSGSEFGQVLSQFYHPRSRGYVLKIARNRGWVFHRNGTHSCHLCALKGIPEAEQ